ncbi:MAG TPA: M20/M25/M40 family metallo-hydrolase [Bryobacteraceae bacterium]|nr:M20/M25/M40 family metallo-hydrolase [Bryobacteraceae bacterium]
MLRRIESGLALVLTFALTVSAQERVDLGVIHQIKDEAFQNPKVMDTMFQLTDVYGPRLTNSPQFRAAGDWAVKQLKDFGLDNVKLEKWGPFGRGWAYTSYSGFIDEPQYQPLIGYPLAWTPGTDGPLTAEAVLAPIRTEADLEQYKGKLRGKMVLRDAPRNLTLPTDPVGRRLTDAQLVDLSVFPIPAPPGRNGRNGPPPLTPEQARKFRERLNQFWKDEGVPLVIRTSTGDGGIVFVQGADRESKDNLPTIVLDAEHYNRIARLLDHKLTVKLTFDVKAQFFDDNLDSFNVIAEIPGNAKRDEVVMVGAHFDSWHTGTGATDNAAGSAVAMEVMRILKTLNLKMDRTVRLALWGGEEEGLLGSQAYVKEHFADPTTMKPTAEHERFAGYFNLDNGSGKIRGVNLQGNDAMRPIFEKWFEPFRDLGSGTIALRNTGGTDHLSFDAVGLPGFQYIQDPLDYATRTHHSNMDVYDRIQATDLEQAAAIMASMVYNTATRPDKLPRKPLPKPRPPEPGQAAPSASAQAVAPR